MVTKMRSYMKEMKANAWTYYNYRQQKKMKSNLQLFKVLSLVQDKMKNHKFFAFSKIKERSYVLQTINEENCGS